jgi:protein ImuA
MVINSDMLDGVPGGMGLLERARAVLARAEAAGEEREAGGHAGHVGQAEGVLTGWSVVDGDLRKRGMARGVVHEWFGFAVDGAAPAAPLGILGHLAGRSLGVGGAGGYVAWIGRDIWPYPHGLVRGEDRRVLGQSIWFDARGVDERVWTIEQAMGCAGVGAVIADGSSLAMSATRRLQLAARSSGALVMLARPPGDWGMLSAASVRWRVEPTVSPTDAPRWRIELVRAKGQGMGGMAGGVSGGMVGVTGLSWIVERRHEEGCVNLFAASADGPDSAATAAVHRRTA